MVSLHATLVFLALSGTGQTELLDFYSDGCAPCRRMDPTVRELAALGYPVRRVNVTKERALAAQFGVQDIPCFVMVVDGREVDRQVGATSLGRLEQMASLGRGAARDAPMAGPPAPAVLPVAGNVPPAAPRWAAPTAGGETSAADAAMLAASVRLRIEDADGHSCGSGTIIASRAGEALILTCGHIFRDSQGKGRIEVDLFGPQPASRIPGQLIGYDLQRDVGLVAIRPPVAVTVARVAPSGYSIRPDDPVASVGCNNGDTPTIQRSHVISLDRFLGPPNIQVAGQPIVGRSGGGLFSADGRVIGVCNAADPAQREGLFAALGTVQAELDQRGLAWVYGSPGPAAPPRSELAAVAGPPAGSEPPAPRIRMPTPAADPAGDGPNFRGPDAQHGRENGTVPLSATATTASNGLAPGEQAAMAEIERRVSDGAEVVCIIRDPRDPQARSQVIRLDRASPALVNQLSAVGQPADARVETSLAIPRSHTPILEWDIQTGWQHHEPLPRPGP